MHKSENEKIDFILDEHERISRKQGSLCMALGKGFLVIAILCGVATFCVSGLYLKSLCLSVACKRTARAVLTGMCYSAGSAMRHGSSSLTRLTG
ncbi:hypothetical protein QU852_25825, partial [Escherichia coli]|nr:hypothetical protein [Escherichia coli]